MINLSLLKIVNSKTISFNFELSTNLNFTSSKLRHFDFLCFTNSRLVDFKFKYFKYFENSDFIMLKFGHFKNFNFAEFKLNYFKDYFVVIKLVNFKCFDYCFRQLIHSLGHLPDYLLTMQQQMYSVNSIINYCFEDLKCLLAKLQSKHFTRFDLIVQ